jgi:kinetochore protein Nuf2
MSLGMKQVYSFPLLKVGDILLCLNELGIPVTEDELTHPEKNKEQIRRIYEVLTELCTGTSREELSQPGFSGLKRLSYPELHEESIPLMNSLRACQKMMEMCAVNDFTIKDFMEPNLKRFRRQLSGIINFAKFKEERLVLFTELTNQRESVLKEFNKSRTRNEELSKRLAILQEQTKEEAKIIADIEIECKGTEISISELNQRQAEIREEISDLKSSNTKLKDTITARTLYLDELQQNRKKFQGQIVSSPGRFRKQISDVNQSLHEEQQNIRVSERKLRELLAWTLHVDECLGLISTAQDSLNEVQVESNKHREAMSSLDELHHQVELKQDILKTLELNIHQLQRQSVRVDDKLSHVRQQGADRTQESRGVINQLHSEVTKCERARSEIKGRVDKQRAESMQLQKQLELEVQLQDQVRR